MTQTILYSDPSEPSTSETHAPPLSPVKCQRSTDRRLPGMYALAMKNSLRTGSSDTPKLVRQYYPDRKHVSDFVLLLICAKCRRVKLCGDIHLVQQWTRVLSCLHDVCDVMADYVPYSSHLTATDLIPLPQ
ncbi:hypothetical protein J6590_080976 [Homalodisca vitripennis]|nr:hypothetical protein J6590_080976 [Homalodisca vitripennis]